MEKVNAGTLLQTVAAPKLKECVETIVARKLQSEKPKTAPAPASPPRPTEVRIDIQRIQRENSIYKRAIVMTTTFNTLCFAIPIFVMVWFMMKVTDSIHDMERNIAIIMMRLSAKQ